MNDTYEEDMNRKTIAAIVTGSIIACLIILAHTYDYQLDSLVVG